jgi:hypothetical protein
LVKIINTPFSDPRLKALGVSLKDDDGVAIRIDFDRLDVPKVSGVITVVMRSPNAMSIVQQLQDRSGEP